MDFQCYSLVPSPSPPLSLLINSSPLPRLFSSSLSLPPNLPSRPFLPNPFTPSLTHCLHSSPILSLPHSLAALCNIYFSNFVPDCYNKISSSPITNLYLFFIGIVPVKLCDPVTQLDGYQNLRCRLF